MSNRREILCDIGLEDSVVFFKPDYDDAIVGFDCVSDRVVYDYDKMVDFIMREMNMGIEEATDFVNVNTINSLHSEGLKSPIILKSIEEFL